MFAPFQIKKKIKCFPYCYGIVLLQLCNRVFFPKISNIILVSNSVGFVLAFSCISLGVSVCTPRLTAGWQMGVFKEKKIFDENPVFKKEPCTLWYTYNNNFEFLYFQVLQKNSNSIRQYSFCARLQNINCQHSTCVTVSNSKGKYSEKSRFG